MIKGRRYTLLLIFILACVSMVSVSTSKAQFFGFALSPPDAAAVTPGLRSDAFTRMSPLLPYSPFGESFPGLTIDPFISALLSNPFPLLLFGPLSSASSLPSPIWPPYLFPTMPVAPTTLNPVAPTPLTTVAGIPMRTAAQTGTWVGTWQSNYIAFIVLWHTGPMTLNIVVDPLTGAVTGNGTLQGSRYSSILFNVFGVEANNLLTVSGFLGTGYYIYLDGTLTSTTTMTGSYTVVGTSGGTILDYGTFNLTLI